MSERIRGKTDGFVWSKTQKQGDDGCPYTEWYTDDEGASGYGYHAMIQRWDGPHHVAPHDPLGEWCPVERDERLDRTDPGYWKDIF